MLPALGKISKELRNDHRQYAFSVDEFKLLHLRLSAAKLVCKKKENGGKLIFYM